VEVVAEAANGQEAVELCRRLRPELMLMDLRMPVMDGIAATHAIMREQPETLVLILTAVDESKGLSDSLEAGAAGYELKNSSPAQITVSVRKVLSGGSSLDGDVAMRLLMSLINGESHIKDLKGGSEEPCPSERLLGKGSESRPDDSSLTSREVEVLRLMVQGQTNQQIARTLALIASTVKRHIRNMSVKIGVSDRVQAAMRAIELGLLENRSGD
jgi:DNA-binding NarL/FixJ family response regulator